MMTFKTMLNVFVIMRISDSHILRRLQLLIILLRRGGGRMRLRKASLQRVVRV